jgi:Cd2+/Zn2+-exporting ATPase
MKTWTMLGIFVAVLMALPSCQPGDAASSHQETFTVPDMTCMSCAATMRGAMREVDGVVTCSFDIKGKTITIEVEENGPDREALAAVLTKAGYPPAPPKLETPAPADPAPAASDPSSSSSPASH